MVKWRTQRSTNTVEAINSSFIKFLEPLEPEELYKKIVQEAVKLVDGKDGRIILNGENGLYIAYSSSPKIIATEIRKKGFTETSFRERKAFVLHAEEFEPIHPGILDLGYKSIIFIPLHYKKNSYGVLMVRSKKEQVFDDEELEILKLFGSMASMTLKKTQLLSETKKNLELKEKFIALTAHELRTPLTSMSGYIQLLNRKLSGGTGKEVQWVEMLHQESKRLTVLIEELLEINKMNAVALDYNFRECNLTEIVKEVITEAEKTYHQFLFQYISAPIDLFIIGDRNKIKRVLVNVIENAVKFSSEGNRITIALKKNKAYSIISIEDFGKGINKEDLPYIFDGFYKGKGNEQEGMGLGLYFSRNIMKSHKGKINVKSFPRRGTKVSLYFPNIL